MFGGKEVVREACVFIGRTARKYSENLMVGEGNQSVMLVGNQNTSGGESKM